MTRRSTTWPSVPLHRFERILGAGDVVLERVDAGRTFRAQSRRFLVRAHVLDMHQQIGQAALDRFQVAEARVGGVQPLHQLDDAILEMADRDIVAARLLDLLDLVGQRLHQRFQPRRHVVAALRALGQRVGERGNAMLEIVERIAAVAGRRHVLDLLGQHLHLGRKSGHRVVEATWLAISRSVVMACSSCCSVAGSFCATIRSILCARRGHRVVEADQVFRRRQPAQRIAHFGEPVLDAGERAAVDAGLAAFRDALG